MEMGRIEKPEEKDEELQSAVFREWLQTWSHSSCGYLHWIFITLDLKTVSHGLERESWRFSSSFLLNDRVLMHSGDMTAIIFNCVVKSEPT